DGVLAHLAYARDVRHVADGTRNLVRQRLEQAQLLVGHGPVFERVDRQRADELARVQQRRDHHQADAVTERLHARQVTGLPACIAAMHYERSRVAEYLVQHGERGTGAGQSQEHHQRPGGARQAVLQLAHHELLFTRVVDVDRDNVEPAGVEDATRYRREDG